MKIRKATKKDLNEIAKIFLEYGKFEHKLDKNVKLLNLKDIISSEKEHINLGTIYFIAENDEGNCLGVLNANIDRRGREKIGVMHTLIVTEKARGKGIGNALVKYVFDYFKKKGCGRARTFIHRANKNALAFWIKQGFETEAGFIGSKRL